MIIYSIINIINMAAIHKLVKMFKDKPYEPVYFILVKIKYPKIRILHNMIINKSSFTFKSKSVFGIIEWIIYIGIIICVKILANIIIKVVVL